MEIDDLRKKYKEKYGVDNPHPNNTDITEIPDEVLSNIHIYGFYDKFSTQAQVEMSRRLKNAIEKMDQSTRNYSQRLIVLTWVLVGIGFITIGTLIYQIINFRQSV